jgi:hypothetical protein
MLRGRDRRQRCRLGHVKLELHLIASVQILQMAQRVISLLFKNPCDLVMCCLGQQNLKLSLVQFTVADSNVHGPRWIGPLRIREHAVYGRAYVDIQVCELRLCQVLRPVRVESCFQRSDLNVVGCSFLLSTLGYTRGRDCNDLVHRQVSILADELIDPLDVVTP